MAKKNEKIRRPIAVLEIITGIGILLFWLGFFTVGLAPAVPPPGYLSFEYSFPLSDSILAATLIIAGILNLKGKPAGRVLSLVSAGALIFLGLLDFSFNIQNGMYTLSALDTALNAFINLWCVGFGLALFLRFRKG
jgi:hypothetical protein